MSRPREVSRFARGALLVLLAAAVLALHLVYLRPGGPWLHQPAPLPLLRDEGTTLYDSFRIVLGETMFRDFFQFQGPAYFHLIAAVFAVTGPSVAAARLLTLLLSGLSAILVAVIVRRFCGWVAGASAALIHTVVFFPVWPVAYAHWGAEAAVLGALALLARDGESRPRVDLAAGALLGTAVLTVQSLGLPALVAAAGLTTLPGLAARDWRGAAMRAATLTAGAALPTGVALIYFASAGALAALHYATLVWPFEHYLQGRGGAAPFGFGLALFLENHASVPEPWRSLTGLTLRSIVLLPLLMAAGIVVVFPVTVARLWKGSREFAFAIASVVSLAVLTPLLSGRVWSDVTHIAFVGSFALIGVAAVCSVVPRRWRLVSWAPAGGFAALAAIGTANYGYKLAGTWALSQKMGNWRAEALKLPLARELHETTDPSARIVAGTNGGFYYLYVRPAAVGFTYIPLRSRNVPGVLSDAQWGALAAQIVERRPAAMYLTPGQWGDLLREQPTLREIYELDRRNSLYRLRMVRGDAEHEGGGEVSAPSAFERYAGNPILGVARGWEAKWVHPYSVLRVGEEVWMWYGGGEDGTPDHVGLAISDDGLSWRRYPGNPIVSPDPAAWDRYAVQHWTVIRKDDRFVALYAAETEPDRRFRIGYAESDDGIAWTRAFRPVLEPGPPGSWDGHFTVPAAVIEVGREHWMYYWGGTSAFGTQTWKVGLAVSTDLEHWQKHPANPIFEGRANSWELGVLDMDIVRIDGNYYMLYQGNSHPRVDISKLGLAVSKDGIDWVRLGLEPFFGNGPPGSWDEEWAEGPVLFRSGDRWLMYYMGTTASRREKKLRRMQIGVAISKPGQRGE